MNDDGGEKRGDREMADLRSFGRRRGRKASAHQRRLLDDLLPRVTVDLDRLARARSPSGEAASASSVPEALACGEGDVWLEIGFGGGEHLLWQARDNPAVAVIGSEPFEDGVVKVLTAIEAGGLGNVRVWADDVRPMLRVLPDASLARVFILFPDPWPKRRHVKRRLIQPALVAELARVMRPGAELRFATDIGDYARTALLAVYANGSFDWTAARPADWRHRPDDWPATRYEQKAVREERRCYFFSFRRSLLGDANSR